MMELNNKQQKIFEQMQRYGHSKLKIFLFGMLLNGPEDPETDFQPIYFGNQTIRFCTENPTRLADKTEPAEDEDRVAA